LEIVGRIFGVLLILAAIALFYVLFPLWASRYAKQRGRDTLAKIAKISIFILLGPYGALAAWIGSMSHPPLEQAQSECPECGSNEVKTETHTLESTSGKDLGTPIRIWVNAGGSILIGGLIAFQSWGLYTEFLEWAGFTGPVPAVIMAVIGLGLVVGGVRSLLVYYNKRNQREYHYTCRNCEHVWQEIVESAKRETR
jgi:DNA-directed RNA polymerase subunit M/transcription elongation factor TFIIS